MKAEGKSAELLIASWFLNSAIEVFLPTAQDVQSDLVILARELTIKKLANLSDLPVVKIFEPRNKTNIVREPLPFSPLPLINNRRMYAVEVKTGKKHEQKSVDFDFLVYLDKSLNFGAISRSSRYAPPKSPNHFPNDNLPTMGSMNGDIVLPSPKTGMHASIVYFSLPRDCAKRSEFFARVFIAFAEGALS